MTLLQLGLILVQSFKKINQDERDAFSKYIGTDIFQSEKNLLLRLCIYHNDDELSEALLNDIKGLVDLFNGLNIIIDLLSELYDITISVGLPDDLYLKEPESPPESDW